MARTSRRYAAALLAGACVAWLGACSPSAGPDTLQRTSETGSASDSVPPTGQPESTSGALASTRTSVGPATLPGSPATTATSTPTSSDALPGGVGPTAALAEAGYLRDGRIVLGSLRALAVAADDDTDSTESAGSPAGHTAADLCHYLFGSAEEVATLTRIAAAAHLSGLSGPHLAADVTGEEDSPDGVVVACVYADDATPQVVLQVGTGAPVDPDLPGQPVIVDGDGVQAVLSYAPDHAGPRIDGRTARDWLTAALDRVAADG